MITSRKHTFGLFLLLGLMLSGFGLITGCDGQNGNTVKFDSAFGLLLPGDPKVESLSPDTGPSAGGTTVIINGEGFRSGIRVFFGSQEATSVTVLSFGQLQVTTPRGKAGTVNVTVFYPTGETFTLVDGYTYLEFEVIPNLGAVAGGTQVTIIGANFTRGTRVFFGSGNESHLPGTTTDGVIVNGPTEIVMSTPPSPTGTSGSVDVIIQYANGEVITIQKGFFYSPWSFETPDNTTESLNGIDGVNANSQEQVIAVGNAAFANYYRKSDGVWELIRLTNGSGIDILTALGAPWTSQSIDFYGITIVKNSTNVIAYIVGEGGVILRRNQTFAASDTRAEWATNWEIVRSPSTSDPDFRAVWATVDASQNVDVWVTGEDYTVHEHQDAQAGTMGTPDTNHTTAILANVQGGNIKFQTSNTMYAIWGFGTPAAGKELFVCGREMAYDASGSTNYRTNLLKFNGTSWSVENTDSAIDPSSFIFPSLRGIIGFEPAGGGNVVYIVGHTSRDASGSSSSYSTILRGFSSGGGAAYSWTRESLATTVTRSLYSVWGSGENEIFASGDSGTILNKPSSGSGWSQMPAGSKYIHFTSATTWDYNACYGYLNTSNTAEEVFVVGFGGRVMHHLPGSPPSAINTPHMWFQEDIPSGTVNGQTINDIYGNAWNSIFAVGTGGTVLYGQNTTASPNAVVWNNNPMSASGAPATSSTLNGVWMSGPGNAFVVGQNSSGNGIINHFDGVQWGNPQRSLTLSDANSSFNDVFGLDPENIYAVGNGGRIYFFNGQAWTQVGSGTTTADLTGVWGRKSGSTISVVVIGKGGTILQFDGTTWSTQTSGTSEDLVSIDGSFTSRIYIVGNNGTVLRYSYSTFSPTITPQTLPSGTTSVNYKGVWVNDIDDIYVAGDGGILLQNNGSTTGWTQLNSPTNGNLSVVFGVDPSEMYLGSTSGNIFRGHSHWVVQVVRTFTTRNYTFAIMDNPGGGVQTWVVASDGSTAQKLSNRWRKQDSPTSSQLRCIARGDASNLWAVGSSGAIIHFDGSSWIDRKPTGLFSTMYWVWAADASNIWAVGSSRNLWYSSGTTFSQITSFDTTDQHSRAGTFDWLQFVEGRSDTDVWIVGDFSAIHNDGNKGSGNYVYRGENSASTTNNGFDPSIWINRGWMCPNTGMIFAVGYSGNVAIYDGTAGKGTNANWKTSNSTSGPTPTGTTSSLWAAYGRPGGSGGSEPDVWMVGTSGTILHYYQGSIREWDSGTTQRLNGVWVDSTNNIAYACGNSGVLLSFDYSKNTVLQSPTSSQNEGWVQEPISTTKSFFWVTGFGGQVTVTSEFGTVLVK